MIVAVAAFGLFTALAFTPFAQVMVTPGSAFGPSGEGWVRMALVQDIPALKTVVARVAQSGLFA